MDRRRRRALLAQLGVAVLVATLVAVGSAAVFLGQKQSERNAYAAARAGPACQAVAGPPAFVATASLKRLAIGAASFAYVRGDADCTTLRPGLVRGDEERLVCTFDHPGFVEARTPGGQAAYVVPYGQAVLVAEPHGPLRRPSQPVISPGGFAPRHRDEYISREQLEMGCNPPPAPSSGAD